jgi:hypothetical protein
MKAFEAKTAIGVLLTIIGLLSLWMVYAWW